MVDFKLDFLDHVAIRVKDIDASVAWYEKVLGLQRYQLPKWGDFPIFMLSGKTGIALFPANTNDPKLDSSSMNVKIDHFAFHVSNEAFAKARKHYESLGIDYSFQDHHYFHSIYTKDLDGHDVELTTLVVDATDFYG
ncbi:catechol 2,3-dioxygenase-like lactoylglutathione lyase family enzyme [Kordia periserrulae]|uniref:Catechol 2,3-dioxygenase-like lactoylglutathione lyase family enzyme n=1 Tax=Kordia periserrulae TaxID=701523 RepID=A0A2T6BRJ8_9FLAO|nr:VOC family protein [Kordia periserrulae]PTX58710.1 catechol 2,3-dioxygenase-like lactoylglutathione lyase family enzyme [Kordia periserrulae]